MKYNLGCGGDYRFGWINVDCQAAVAPDVMWDLGQFPWPFETDSADEVAMIHLLDEMPSGLLPRVMQELYRICRSGAKLTLRNTDPRHADAALKPPGSGGIAPTAFQSYDLAVVEDWLARGQGHTPSGLYAAVDFATRSTTTLLDPRWAHAVQGGALQGEALSAAMLGQNNVVACSETVLEARKPFAPGRSLAEADALVLARFGGLGDVLMALSACRAIRSVSDRPIYLLTAPAFRDFAALCPFVDRVLTTEDEVRDHAAARGHKALKVLDLGPVRFGISRLHQVDAYLSALNLSPDDGAKGLTIDLPRAAAPSSAAKRLAALPRHARRVVLHAGLSDPNRTFPAAFWSDLADHCLARGHAVIAIGQNGGLDGRGAERFSDPRVLDLGDALDLAGSLEVLRASDLLISADSGPVQLAGASDIGIIGLYTTVGGEKRLPYRHGSFRHRAAAVGPDCPFSPCYRWMSDPGTVVDFERISGIGADDVPGLFSRWCVTPEPYACTREASMGDKVKALIPAMLAQVDADRSMDPVRLSA